jgi:hypothetical protein
MRWWFRSLRDELLAKRSARPWAKLAVTADLRKSLGFRDLEPITQMTATEERMALIDSTQLRPTLRIF